METKPMKNVLTIAVSMACLSMATAADMQMGVRYEVQTVKECRVDATGKTVCVDVLKTVPIVYALEASAAADCSTCPQSASAPLASAVRTMARERRRIIPRFFPGNFLRGLAWRLR